MNKWSILLVMGLSAFLFYGILYMVVDKPWIKYPRIAYDECSGRYAIQTAADLYLSVDTLPQKHLIRFWDNVAEGAESNWSDSISAKEILSSFNHAESKKYESKEAFKCQHTYQ